MPGFDGTGPAGRGPGTGGGRGYCSFTRRRPGRFANRLPIARPSAYGRGMAFRRGRRGASDNEAPPQE